MLGDENQHQQQQQQQRRRRMKASLSQSRRIVSCRAQLSCNGGPEMTERYQPTDGGGGGRRDIDQHSIDAAAATHNDDAGRPAQPTSSSLPGDLARLVQAPSFQGHLHGRSWSLHGRQLDHTSSLLCFHTV